LQPSTGSIYARSINKCAISKCFTRSDLGTYFAAAIRSRLREISAPTSCNRRFGDQRFRPKDVTERTWNDVLALRKQSKKKPARRAPHYVCLFP
jgi:hypothetical protein